MTEDVEIRGEPQRNEGDPVSDGARILIVEDSPTQAELLRHLLEMRGYSVTHAPNGNLALIEARRAKPALIISDVEMPSMGGYEMCHAIKTDPQLRDVPVILLTSLADPADVFRGLEAKTDYYLTKPYDGAYLLTRVEAALAVPLGADGAAPTPSLRVFFDGEYRAVTANYQQLLNLLLSTYGNAVQQNRELIKVKNELMKSNQMLVQQTKDLQARDLELQSQNKRLEETACSERQANETLRRAQAQLIQTDTLASLGQMAAGVAHEINNPLAFVSNDMAVLQRDIGGISELLSLYGKCEINGQQSEIAESIHECSERIDLNYTLPNLHEIVGRSRDGLRRIQQIVADLRDFARLDTSDVYDVDLNAGITSTVNLLRTMAAAKQVRIEVDLATLPLIECYPAKINQVVRNLLSNAVDASFEGSKVLVRSRADDREIRIEFKDTGVGIAPSILDRIFDPFFTTKPPGAGSGLGLSTSYGIVHEHGGSIEVDSAPGKGSRFIVHLPTDRPRRH